MLDMSFMSVMSELLRFPFIKIISLQKTTNIRSFDLKTSKMLKEYDKDFLSKIQFGDILKSSGDILLCPVSENFKPSNSLSRKIIKKEGKLLKKEIESLCSSDSPKWIGSEHVAFLPCRKLKYRGILFVSIDFYSDNREDINAARIAEALEVADKYNCIKLTCPQNLLYSPEDNNFSFDYIECQWVDIILALKDKIKIDFVIENLVQKNLLSFLKFQNSTPRKNIRYSLIEYLPDCAQILPHYRKKLKYIRTVYNFSARTARQLRKLLTNPIKDSKALHLFKKLQKIMGVYHENGSRLCNEGFEFFVFRLCKEMPWNFQKLKELFENLPEDKYGSFNNFIFEKRFSDLSMFEYRSNLREE